MTAPRLHRSRREKARYFHLSWRCPFRPGIFIFILVVTGSLQIAAQQTRQPLLTVAEQSDYQATCTFQELAEFVDNCCVQASHVTRHDFGRSVEGRPMISAVIANPPYSIGTSQAHESDDRLRVLLLGNIHSGECAGKEGLLMVLRELAANPNHPWLNNAVIVIAPNYNVDANERIGKNNRPGQVGPSAGMGQRANPQQLDLNRDFIKLESPEARSLVSLMNQFDPHMFIDCHTTNGSRHRYLLTYDVPHNPSTPQEIRDFLRRRMMPQVTADLEAKGIPTFFYGNFSRDYSRWTTYGHEPRYSTEYFGLRGRFGILSEAYSYATYKQRIEASKAFVEQCVEYVVNNAVEVRQLLQDVRDAQFQQASSEPQQVLMHIDSQVAPFEEKVVVRGFDGDAPKDYEVTFVADYEPTKSVPLPFCYVIPSIYSWQAQRLALHGIDVEQVQCDQMQTAEVFQITQVRMSPRSFQNHNMASVETASRSERRVIKTGDFVIRTGQPLGRLAAYMLEPESNDGLVTWNFFDRNLKAGADFPVLRINEPVEIATVRLDEIPPGGRLALSDIFGPDKIEFNPASLRSVDWVPGTDAYTVERSGRTVQVDVVSGAESRLQFPWQRNELTSALQKIEGIDRSTANEIVRDAKPPQLEKQRLFLFSHNDKSLVYDTISKVAVDLSDNGPVDLATLDPSGQWVAYVENGDLKILKDLDAEPISVTSDGGDQILNGKLDWVYQEELYGRGNFKGFWWSPGSHYIAFLRLDETPVQRYTVTDHLPVRGKYEVTPYPKAGDPLPTVSLGIYSINDKRLTWVSFPVSSDAPDFLISRVTWNEGHARGKNCFVQVQNRQQTWLDLYSVNPDSREATRLFRDQTPAWIETPGDPIWVDDDSFLWLSPRNGFNHIYHYDSSGSLIAQVTDGGWEVRSMLGVSNDHAKVFFTGSPQSPTRVEGLVADIASGNVRSITNGKGSHTLKFNHDFTYFLGEYSSTSQPDQVNLHRADGTLVRSVIPNLDDRLNHLRIAEPEFISVPLEDGTILNAQMIKPFDFDPQKKYPVLVHVYSGPQAPRVRDRFGGTSYLWHQYLAQAGYVIWMCDNRSASYNGAKYAWPIHRDLGRNELEDIKAGLNWLKQKPWIDPQRIGIWGWSYGGYMTAFAMTHCDLFKAGISGAPVTDWKNYDAIYTERYMDTPQNNPSGYTDSSVVNAAGQLHGELLLIHGTIDDNVHISNSMQLAHALQKAGKHFQLMVYPNNRHGVRDPEQQLHLYQLMTKFLLENL